MVLVLGFLVFRELKPIIQKTFQKKKSVHFYPTRIKLYKRHYVRIYIKVEGSQRTVNIYIN